MYTILLTTMFYTANHFINIHHMTLGNYKSLSECQEIAKQLKYIDTQYGNKIGTTPRCVYIGNEK